MRNSSFEQKMNEWAETTSNAYHEIALRYDLAFYTQSNLNKVDEQPELLILGINPGSGGTYVDHSVNEMWKEWGVKDRMDGATLLKGNPSFKDKDKWSLWQGLSRVFNKGGITGILNDESKYAWSNIIFLNQPKERNIERELYEICPKYTLELIRILRPKRILCLSIRKCFDVLNKEIKNHEVLIDSFLEKGKLFDIPVYGIRHTSYGNVGEKVVGKCLKYLFDAEPQRAVSKEELCDVFAEDIEAMIKEMKERKPNPSKEKRGVIVQLCVGELVKKNWRFHEEKNNRFEIVNGHLSLTITNVAQGFVGIRYRNNELKPDDKISAIMEVLIKFGFKIHEMNKGRYIWVGSKDIKRFQGSTPEDISNNIVSDLEALIPELERLYK